MSSTVEGGGKRRWTMGLTKLIAAQERGSLGWRVALWSGSDEPPPFAKPVLIHLCSRGLTRPRRRGPVISCFNALHCAGADADLARGGVHALPPARVPL